MEVFQILIIISIFCLVIEVFTPLFLFASFAVGFLFSAYGSFADYSLTNQVYGFVIGSGLSFIFVKPLFQKYAYNKDVRRMNQDVMIGKIGIVTSKIDNIANEGLVKIDGVNWKAFSVNGDIIEINKTVEIVDIDSIVLHVIKNE
jgi:membrane protein implicated in regulation of membrane protease activity